MFDDDTPLQLTPVRPQSAVLSHSFKHDVPSTESVSQIEPSGHWLVDPGIVQICVQ